MAEPSKTLREIVRVIASRFIGMVVIFIIIVGAVWAATYFAPRQYRSTATLTAKPTNIGPMNSESASLRDVVSLFVSTQRELMTRDEVIAAALILLEENKDKPADKDFKLPAATASSPDDAAWKTATDAWDKRVASYKNKNAEKVRRAKDSVNVVTPGGPDAQYTQTFTINVDWREDRDMFAMPTKASAEKAAEDAYRFARYLLNAYLYYYTRGGTESESKTVAYYERIVNDKKSLFQTAEKKRAECLQGFNPAELKYIVEGGVSGVETGLAATISQLDSKLTDTKMKIIDAKALRDVITETLKNSPENIAVPELVIAANPSIKTIEDKINRLKHYLKNIKHLKTMY